MKKHEKVHLVNLLREEITKANAAFLVNFKGLTVKQMQALRKDLRRGGGVLKISKVRLMERAVRDMEGVSLFKPYLKDQVALVFAHQDFLAIAKVLHGFSKKNEALRLIAGFFESKVVDKSVIVRIAQLPTKEVLVAQLCGLLQGQVARLAWLLNRVGIKSLSVEQEATDTVSAQ